MTRVMSIVILVLVALMLVSCAPNTNPYERAKSDQVEVAGFWTGLWQGATMFFTFIWSLFNDKVGVYETVNNGNWYNFGYLLGAMMFLGGGSSGAAAGSRGSKSRSNASCNTKTGD